MRHRAHADVVTFLALLNRSVHVSLLPCRSATLLFFRLHVALLRPDESFLARTRVPFHIRRRSQRQSRAPRCRPVATMALFATASSHTFIGFRSITVRPGS